MYKLKQQAGSQPDLLFLESSKEYILINISSSTTTTTTTTDTQISRSRPSSPVNASQYKPLTPQPQHKQISNAAPVAPLPHLKQPSNNSIAKIQSDLLNLTTVKGAAKPGDEFTFELKLRITNEKVVRKEIEADLIRNIAKSAKYSEWNDVWRILDKNPDLINCIPNERAWSVLHQAVWYDNVKAVRKILSYPACDPQIRTKLDITEDSGVGMRPIELAKSQEIKAILKATENILLSNIEAPTMLNIKKIENSLGGCIIKTLSCNQGVLIPIKWNFKGEESIQSIPYLMRTIFDFVNTADNWVNTRNKISLTIQQYSKSLGDKLWRQKAKNCDTKDCFYGRVIRLYTEERNSIYKEMNRMLRLQDNSIEGYKPDGMQLSLCPYSLLLNSIIMEWSEMNRYTGITYRSCSLTKEEANQYVKGQRFVWLSFSSCSKEEMSREPDSYMIVIDNSMYSDKWLPREITRYSKYPYENECLYPFGAQFEVTDVKGKHICLKLIDY